MSEKNASPGDFKQEVAAAAERAFAALAHGRKTAWELKIELKVTHTLLHLALGMLLERGKISLQPDNLTYSVEPLAPDLPQNPIMTAKAGPTVNA